MGMGISFTLFCYATGENFNLKSKIKSNQDKQMKERKKKRKEIESKENRYFFTKATFSAE